MIRLYEASLTASLSIKLKELTLEMFQNNFLVKDSIELYSVNFALIKSIFLIYNTI